MGPTRTVAAVSAHGVHGPRKEAPSSSGTQVMALKGEKTQLLREVARLQAAVAANRDRGSYEQLQVHNSKLVHQMKQLEHEAHTAKQERDRMQEMAQTMQSTLEAEIQSLRQQVEEANQVTLEAASDATVAPLTNKPEVEETTAPSATEGGDEDTDAGAAKAKAAPTASDPSPAPAPTAAVANYRYLKKAEKEKEVEEDGAPSTAAEADAEFLAWSAPAASIPPTVHAQQQREWAAHKGTLIESFIRSGAYAFLDVGWLIRFAERFAGRKPLPPRQNLPPDAFMSLEQLKVAGCPYELLPIFVVSGCASSTPPVLPYSPLPPPPPPAVNTSPTLDVHGDVYECREGTIISPCLRLPPYPAPHKAVAHTCTSRPARRLHQAGRSRSQATACEWAALRTLLGVSGLLVASTWPRP